MRARRCRLTRATPRPSFARGAFGMHALLLSLVAARFACALTAGMADAASTQPIVHVTRRMQTVIVIRNSVRRVASFNLEEYETAKEAFDAAAVLEPSNTSYQSWTAKCKAALDSEIFPDFLS